MLAWLGDERERERCTHWGEKVGVSWGKGSLGPFGGHPKKNDVKDKRHTGLDNNTVLHAL